MEMIYFRSYAVKVTISKVQTNAFTVGQDIPLCRGVESIVMDIGRYFVATGLFVRKLFGSGFTPCYCHLEGVTSFIND